MAKRKAVGKGGRPAREKKPITLAQPKSGAPLVRDTGAAPVKLAQVTATFTEFTRLADHAPVVVHQKGTRVYSVPLDYYQHRGVIDNDQWTAGERLMQTHRIAFGSGFHSVNLDGFHGTTNYSDNWRVGNSQGDALRDYIKTLQLFDAKQREMLESVCCRDEYASAVARRIGLNPKTSVSFLRDCLTALSLYWRTGQKPNAPAFEGRGDGRH